MANTISSALNCGLLLHALRRKLKTLDLAPLRASLAGLAGGGVAAGVVTWLAWGGWERFLGHGTLPLKLGAVFVPAGAAALVYGLVTLACRVPAITEMTELALTRFRRRR
jgi:peptidoglycan biosynthesis protein MviN/MurJ (putative lipid II flippase)